MKTQDDYDYISRWGKKLKAIELLGGICSKCENGDFFNMDFHHKHEGEDKIDQISNIKRWSKMLPEIKKCELLCSNCHNEHHYNKNRIDKEKTKHENNKLLFLQYKNEFACSQCKYSGCIACLDFHHRSSTDKNFRISTIGNYTFTSVDNIPEKIKLEIDSCELICKNCHRKEHFDFNKFNRFKSDILSYMQTYKEPKRYDYAMIKDLKSQGKKNVDIMRMIGCSRRTLYTILHS